MTDVHDFRRSLDLGHRGEVELDRFFSTQYTVSAASGSDDLDGIDRYFEPREGGGQRFSVQYKTDFLAGTTHNAYVETVSVDYAGKPGWAFTRKAKFLCYWIPTLRARLIENLAVFRFDVIGENIGHWMAKHDTKPALNRGYRTWGVCVPWTHVLPLAAYKTTLRASEELLARWERTQFKASPPADSEQRLW